MDSLKGSDFINIDLSENSSAREAETEVYTKDNNEFDLTEIQELSRVADLIVAYDVGAF
jgi:hypothetical protein